MYTWKDGSGDLAFRVIKAFYVIEKDIWKIKVDWYNKHYGFWMGIIEKHTVTQDWVDNKLRVYDEDNK